MTLVLWGRRQLNAAGALTGGGGEHVTTQPIVYAGSPRRSRVRFPLLIYFEGFTAHARINGRLFVSKIEYGRSRQVFIRGIFMRRCIRTGVVATRFDGGHWPWCSRCRAPS